MSKYNSRKVTIDGITYDSKKEAVRHRELMLLERAGIITGLQRQVKYELIPVQREFCNDVIGTGKKAHFKKGKVIERAVTYVADFVYQQDGKAIVEDVKGYRKGTAYDLFVAKRKMMLYFHGLRIKEV